MSDPFPFDWPRLLYYPANWKKSIPSKRRVALQGSYLKEASPVREYFQPFGPSLSQVKEEVMDGFEDLPMNFKLDSEDQEEEKWEKQYKIREAFNEDSELLKSEESQENEHNYTEIFNAYSELIKVDEHGVRTVTNSEGKEFVYFENLEDVRRILSKRKPNMTKNQMYQELLKPYKHKIFSGFDKSTRQVKQVYLCGYSGWNKKFNKTWNLVDHLRMHEGIKPYKCEICQKLFTQKGNLQKHLRQHMITDVNLRKKYECDFCGKRYTERYNCLVSYSFWHYWSLIKLWSFLYEGWFS